MSDSRVIVLSQVWTLWDNGLLVSANTGLLDFDFIHFFFYFSIVTCNCSGILLHLVLTHFKVLSVNNIYSFFAWSCNSIFTYKS